MIVTHGWPGSVLEFTQVIDPLVDPSIARRRAEDDAFHLVLPSLPGYGFSAKPSSPGTGVERIAAMWDELMGRLGYDSYVAQGGDWGSAVTTHIGMQDLGRCRAIHTNMPVAGPSKESMADLTAKEQAALESMGYYDKWDSGYSKQQSSRPQTIGYSLVDSPVGLAAWILEKFWSWTDRSAHPEDYYSRDRAAGQRVAVLVHRHRAVVGPALLGELRQLRGRGVRHAHGVQHLPQRDLPGQPPMGFQALHRHPLLERARGGRPFRGLRAARAVRGRDAGRLQVPRLDGAANGRTVPFENLGRETGT